RANIACQNFVWAPGESCLEDLANECVFMVPRLRARQKGIYPISCAELSPLLDYASPGVGILSSACSASLCGAVITRRTAAKIMALASMVRSVNGSPPSDHPRKRATTGFTNA